MRVRVRCRTEALRFDFQVMKVKTAPTRRGRLGREETLVAALVPYQGRSAGGDDGTGATLLCSHGNAVDLGQMLPLWKELSRLLKVNIVGCVPQAALPAAGRGGTVACRPRHTSRAATRVGALQVRLRRLRVQHRGALGQPDLRRHPGRLRRAFVEFLMPRL